MYANDILLLIADPLESIPELPNSVTVLGKISGFTIHWSKSEVVPLGDRILQDIFRFWQFKWCPDVIKYLGL